MQEPATSSFSAYDVTKKEGSFPPSFFFCQAVPKRKKRTPKTISKFLMSFYLFSGRALNLSSSHLLEQMSFLLHFKNTHAQKSNPFTL
jgi:hypothetical protein